MENKTRRIRRVKDWEVIADNLKQWARDSNSPRNSFRFCRAKLIIGAGSLLGLIAAVFDRGGRHVTTESSARGLWR
ncbi:MAG: hypothetical protein DME65_11640 [Verrucomicrobia bacterium]|nr:MAG: hypothetical protein DME65_11640 [Verrucomicrobiota bacterium]